jgi:hypothetical protein
LSQAHGRVKMFTGRAIEAEQLGKTAAIAIALVLAA